METVAITGSYGYVGSIIARSLERQMRVIGLVRHPKSDLDLEWSFNSQQLLTDKLRQREVKVLIHVAWDMKASSMEELESICVEGSGRLFSAAVDAGVKRIVFISTISSFEGCRSAYGRSKLAVEALLPASVPGVVLRLGLVFGENSGGMFGSIRQQVMRSSLLPMIGRGIAPQYLLHENTLAEAVLGAARGDYDRLERRPITLAHPRPIAFRDLVRRIAGRERRRVTLVPVPWQLLYAGARAAEMLKIRAPFRSDSIVSFVNYNRNPDFGVMQGLGIKPKELDPEAD